MSNSTADQLTRLWDGKIYLAGHREMVGPALVRRLEKSGCENLVVASRTDLDLTDPRQVSDFFNIDKTDYVFLADAKIDGINANYSNSLILSVTT